MHPVFLLVSGTPEVQTHICLSPSLTIVKETNSAKKKRLNLCSVTQVLHKGRHWNKLHVDIRLRLTMSNIYRRRNVWNQPGGQHKLANIYIGKYGMALDVI